MIWTQGAQLQKHIDATLGSGNLREAVRLPPGEDINEWLAVNSKTLKISDVVVFELFFSDDDMYCCQIGLFWEDEFRNCVGFYSSCVENKFMHAL